MTDPDLSYITEDLRHLAVPIGSVFPDPDNVRLHSSRNLAAIAASLHGFTQRKPVVVNRRTMTVEAGNGTLEAAKALGWDYIAVSHEDDGAVIASGYGIADNRSAELATWNYSKLGEQLRGMAEEGRDLADVGFTSEELSSLLDEMSTEAEPIDPDTIGGYDDEQDYYLVKVAGVEAKDQEAVASRLREVLKQQFPHLKVEAS